ncbi:MAG: DUF2934 domain-containing protein [Candidatus Omnitrophota bacterium]|nr:DUF2934 domain-containing protein [Candidatus Omnitrophota bacterium]
MSKHEHKNRAERLYSNAHGSSPINYEKTTRQASEPSPSVNIQTRAAADKSSIQLKAYQIYQEKGGTDLDNWLEAERMLRDDHN